MEHLDTAKKMMDHTMRRMTEAKADDAQVALSLMIIQTECAIAQADHLKRIADALEALNSRGELAESVRIWGAE